MVILFGVVSLALELTLKFIDNIPSFMVYVLGACFGIIPGIYIIYRIYKIYKIAVLLREIKRQSTANIERINEYLKRLFDIGVEEKICMEFIPSMVSCFEAAGLNQCMFLLATSKHIKVRNSDMLMTMFYYSNALSGLFKQLFSDYCAFKKETAEIDNETKLSDVLDIEYFKSKIENINKYTNGYFENSLNDLENTFNEYSLLPLRDCDRIWINILENISETMLKGYTAHR